MAISLILQTISLSLFLSYLFQSLTHQQNKDTNDNRMYLLKNGTARIDEDGLNQTQYKVLSTVVTDLFTKISVDLLYADYIATYVSISLVLVSNNYMVSRKVPNETLIYIILFNRMILNLPQNLRKLSEEINPNENQK